MPPRRMKRTRAGGAGPAVARGIAGGARENTRGAGENTGRAGGAGGNTRCNVAPEVRGCMYKTFLGCNPPTFSGTKGTIGLSRWIEELESVFQIRKCANEDKVKYGACTLQDEYYPRNELQRMEQELWNLTVKGVDIAGYTNRFHELAALCPSMVTPEYKKIKRYVWGLPEKIQGNVTSSKPATAHEAIRMAHSLMDQAVRFKVARSGEANKRIWEDY
ncbi:putative reverse transcriptase domain-containing protein [Tanacetum coccineum]